MVSVRSSLVLVFVILSLIGCTGLRIDPAQELAEETAVALVERPTSTPEPTATNTPEPTETPLPTATATATATQTPTNTPTPPPTSTPTITPTPLPTATPTIAYGNSGRPIIQPNFDDPTGYLDKYVLITYYGSPLGRALGILGNSPRDEMLKELTLLTKQHVALDGRFSIPTFHMISTVANDWNPPTYRHHVKMEILEEWVEAMDKAEAAAVLDIQPGHASILEEIERVRHLLMNPHVHLGVDPEFVMEHENDIPGTALGRMYAQQINEVQNELSKIAFESGYAQLLILHQFKDNMLPDKEFIVDYPNVEIVWDSDGAFDTRIKIKNYEQYATEGGFEYGGIKFFYEYDDIILEPSEIMKLEPPPAVIIYQ